MADPYSGKNTPSPKGAEAEGIEPLVSAGLTFEDMVRDLGVGVFICNKNGEIAYVNDGLCRMLEMGSADLLQRPVPELAHPDSRPEFQKHMEICRGGEKGSFEARLSARDGRSVPAILSHCPLMSKDGYHGGFSVVMDISDRVRAEANLAESEKRYRQVLENANECILVIQDGLTKMFNRKCVELSGYPAEEIGSRSFVEFLHEDDRELAVTRHYQRLAGDPVPGIYPLRVVDAEGRVRWTDLHSVRIEWENRPATLNFLNEITERRQMEDILRKQEARYEELVRRAPAAILELDLRTGRFLSVNEATCLLTGYSAEELLGMPAIQVFGELSKGEHRERFVAAGRGEKIPHAWKYQIRRKDGSHLWALVNISIEHQHGKPAICRVVGHDITELKLAEDLTMMQKNLSASLALTSDLSEALSLILNAALSLETLDNGGIYVMDQQAGGFVLTAYRGLTEAFAEKVRFYPADSKPLRILTTGKVLYEEYDEIRPPDDPVRKAEGLSCLVSFPILYEGKLVAALNLGSHVYREIPELVRNSIGALVSQLGGVLARIKAQEKLAESEEKYRLLVENATDIICIVLEGKIRFANKVAFDILGYSEAELIGMDYLDLLEPEEKELARKRYDRRVSGELNGRTFSYGFRTKTGELRLAELKGGAITWQDRPALLLVIRDVTEQRKLEEHLAQARRMEAVGTLAGGIAHDFNNLLMAVQGNVSLMLLSTPQGHPDHPRLRNIESCVASGTKLTRQLLGFAKGGHYEVKPCDMNRLLRSSAAMMARVNKNVRVHEDLAANLSAATADPGQMEQVIVNLLVNAFQAMEGGGELFLTSQNIELSSTNVGDLSLAPGRYVRISITDTGPGMEPEVKRRIFEPFFTTKGQGKGVGLGLAVSYGIVQGHRGNIHVYSEPGQGSTFSIYIPASDAPAAAEEEKGRAPTRMSGNILLVEDEENVREVSSSMLHELGFTVICASCGAEAVAAFSREPETFTLVVLDLVMPGMSGQKTYERLREIKKDVKVLLASGYSVDGTASSLLAAGCAGFIQKPFDLSELSSKIAQVLG
ncbi:MAG: PAS domain S-box protein [Thermodesulfobacteriota bacterium]